MYFEEMGDRTRPTLVFIHGGGISGWMWRQQVEYFSDFHCLVPDLPEHGKSSKEGPLSLEDCAARIAHLIETRSGNSKAHVVGHSLGGKVVVELLASRPDLIDRAVVASALFGSMFLLNLVHRSSVYKLTVSMMRSKRLRSWTAGQLKFPDRFSIEKAMEDFKVLTPESLYRIYDQLYQYQEMPNGLAQAQVPTLVMAGEKEPRVMKQSVGEIAGALAVSQGVLLKGADHTYPWTRPDTFNGLVRSWLSEQNIEERRFPGVEFLATRSQRMG
ncbi:carboxylesterase YbfK [Peptococcaceae bacterium CEB3]|nr:carboxylesterase YbfK [Peptococcaceae bacterium CEB3]